jgi:hypothetical protein
MYIDVSRNIYEKMLSQQFVLSMLGTLNHEMLCSIINVTEKKLDAYEVGKLSKKRIFHFMIECAENIHRIDGCNVKTDRNLLLIGKHNNEYAIYIGCICDLIESREIRLLIDEVNSLDRAEIKEKFYAELISNNNYKKKALLLSLLDISKRTREKIGYEIIEVSNNECFLCFRTFIAAA